MNSLSQDPNQQPDIAVATAAHAQYSFVNASNAAEKRTHLLSDEIQHQNRHYSNSNQDAPFSPSAESLNKTNTEDNLKSLSNYVSYMTTGFVIVLICLTTFTFAWSNYYLGAIINVYASPIVPANLIDIVDQDATFSIPKSQTINTLTLANQINNQIITHGVNHVQTSLLASNLINMNTSPSNNSNIKSDAKQNNVVSNSMPHFDVTGFLQEVSKILKENDVSVSVKDFGDLLAGDTSNFSINKQVFSFTLWSSINDFYHSDAYYLGFLIAFWSGIWPYVKLIIMLYCWLKPMNINRRTTVLHYMDQLGKFSLIDLYVFNYMVVSFYMKIRETMKVEINNQYQNAGFKIDVMVEPGVGIMLFVICTVLSLIINNALVFMNKKYVLKKQTINIKKKSTTSLSNNKHAISNMNSIKMDQNINASEYSISHLSHISNNHNSRDDTITSKSNENISDDNNNMSPVSPQIRVAHTQQSKNQHLTENIRIRSASNTSTNDDDNDDSNSKTNSNSNPNLDAVSLQQIVEYDESTRTKTIAIDVDLLSQKWSKIVGSKPFAIHHTPKSFVGIIVRSLAMVMLVVNTWLLVQAAFTAPVGYQIKGLASHFIDDAARAYDSYEIFQLLPETTELKQSAIFLSVIFLITSAITPILCNIAMLWFWLMPVPCSKHSLQFYDYLKDVILLLIAWSGVDILFVGSIAAAGELERVSEWIIDQNFQSICGSGGLTAKYLGEECFSVKGSALPGSWVLVSAALMLWFNVLYTVKSLQWAKKDMIKKIA